MSDVEPAQEQYENRGNGDFPRKTPAPPHSAGFGHMWISRETFPNLTVFLFTKPQQIMGRGALNLDFQNRGGREDPLLSFKAKKKLPEEEMEQAPCEGHSTFETRTLRSPMLRSTLADTLVSNFSS